MLPPWIQKENWKNFAVVEKLETFLNILEATLVETREATTAGAAAVVNISRRV